MFEALLADDELFANGWSGFGIAIQAYQKRAVPLCDWVVEAARAHGRKLMVRLVKGAYWDTEIKLRRSAACPTIRCSRARSRPTSPTSPARKSCSRPRTSSTPPSPPTTPTPSGRSRRWPHGSEFEFQRLHGMGEELYEELASSSAHLATAPTPVRIYAPVGSHKDLLAYLVRRLLENGANSSFVNRIADEEVSVDELVRDPVAELDALEPKRNPEIVLPATSSVPQRRNSPGVDLADPLVREPLLERLKSARSAAVDRASPALGKGRARAIVSPARSSRSTVGTIVRGDSRPTSIALVRAASPRSSAGTRSAGSAGALLDRAADLYEAHAEEFFSLCQREAGKTLLDAVLEVREAVDFLRYYAAEARRQFAGPHPLPGPTGEDNSLHLHGRGVFATIIPWNFPLAIFTGMTSPPLAAGNAVLAKPAEQTPLIAALAVELCTRRAFPTTCSSLSPATARSARR